MNRFLLAACFLAFFPALSQADAIATTIVTRTPEQAKVAIKAAKADGAKISDKGKLLYVYKFQLSDGRWG